MVKKLTENKKLVLVITFIVLIQCAVLVYWQEQRGNFFVDELFSFGYANSFSAESSHYIMGDESWEYDSWMNAEDLISQIEVDADESLLSLSIGKQLSLLTSKRTYMGLLNIVMSFTEPFEGYSRGALAFNILILLVAELLFGKIVFILTRSKEIMVLSLIMFGFSAIIIGMCEYVRFYMFVIMLLLLVLFCHLKLWVCKKAPKYLIIELIAFVSAYYGLMHSELMLVICGSFFCFFFISLLLRRQFRNALIYSLPLLVGTYVFIYQGTNFFDIVFHPSHYANANTYGLGTTAYNVVTVTPERAEECLGLIKECVSLKWFGSGFIALAFLTLSIAWVVLIIVGRSVAEPNNKKTEKYSGFIAVTALTVITYLTFAVLSNLYTDRYDSFPIVLMMILFWYCVGKLQMECPSKKMIAAFAMVTVAGVFMCQQADRLPYLYVDDTTGSMIVEDYQGIDSVIIRSDYAQVIYDCVLHTDRNARIFAINPSREKPLDEDDLPDQFLLWCYISGESDRIHALLDSTGCGMKKLGETHVSAIYLCTK